MYGRISSDEKGPLTTYWFQCVSARSFRASNSAATGYRCATRTLTTYTRSHD